LDNAGGIPTDSIEDALRPWGRTKGRRDLNEHGIGMKASIESLGTLAVLQTKTAGCAAVEVKGPLSHNGSVLTSGFQPQDGHGTRILIDTSEADEYYKRRRFKSDTHFGHNHDRNLERLLLGLGKNYRVRIGRGELKLTIVLCSPKGNTRHSVNAINPLYWDPRTERPEPLFSGMTFTSGDTVAELTFGYAPREEHKEDLKAFNISFDAYKGNHPYAIKGSNAGLDILWKDRVIHHANPNELKWRDSNSDGYSNVIRGELRFISGIYTCNTKNGVANTKEYEDVIAQVATFLKEPTKHKLLGGKWLWNRYTKGNIVHEDEKSLRDRMFDHFKKVAETTEGVKDPLKEHDLGYGLTVDIIHQGVLHELKRDEAGAQDVIQLYGYMLVGDCKKGRLVAKSFSNNAWGLKECIEQKTGCIIELKTPEELI